MASPAGLCPADPIAAVGSGLAADECGSKRRDTRGVAETQFELNALAVSASDVVAHVGGWLCDLSLAGWTVTVTLGKDCDDTPLRILGARTHIEPLLRSGISGFIGESTGVLAISSGLLTDPATDAETVRNALRVNDHSCVWGAPALLPDPLQLRSERYLPSAAALTFKTHALLAAGVDAGPVTTTEMLQRLASPAHRL
jgi:hypothetical protein